MAVVFAIARPSYSTLHPGELRNELELAQLG
jgi:hypothetical protein